MSMSKDKCPDCDGENTNTGRYVLYNSDFDTGYCYDCEKHFPIGRVMKNFFNRKDRTSKNERAKKILGMRQPEVGSTPLFEPIELGYHCPICKSDVKFSEYACMMWCSYCNLDIPSCLCKFTYEPNLSLDPLEGKKLLIEQTRIFLDSVSVLKSNK